jgi:hypothetical protein
MKTVAKIELLFCYSPNNPRRVTVCPIMVPHFLAPSILRRIGEERLPRAKLLLVASANLGTRRRPCWHTAGRWILPVVGAVDQEIEFPLPRRFHLAGVIAVPDDIFEPEPLETVDLFAAGGRKVNLSSALGLENWRSFGRFRQTIDLSD